TTATDGGWVTASTSVASSTSRPTSASAEMARAGPLPRPAAGVAVIAVSGGIGVVGIVAATGGGDRAGPLATRMVDGGVDAATRHTGLRRGPRRQPVGHPVPAGRVA